MLSDGKFLQGFMLLMIQVQKLKVDMESAMLEMDQILKSNELSIALVAAIPALVVAGGLLTLLLRFLSPRPPDPVFEALPCRCAYNLLCKTGLSVYH